MNAETAANDIRARLVAIALEWQSHFGVAPAITSALSEYDAAILLGLPPHVYGSSCSARTAVSRGYDFIFQNRRYQVKANRPSGKPGSFVTLVAKPTNYDWDFLIWILYDRCYEIQEAWLWPMAKYQAAFSAKNRVSPGDMRLGTDLLPSGVSKHEVRRALPSGKAVHQAPKMC
jgi:hypothetical protein